MTLLTQDGKPYRTFSEPNPIMKGQSSLEKDDLVFHNFKWEPKIIIVSQKAPPKSVVKPPEVPRSEAIDDFMETLKREAVALKKEKPPEVKLVIQSPEQSNAVMVYCHPAIVRERKDDLYGDVKKTIQFGDKFSFEAIIIDCNGLEISLFTHNVISKESIVYPSKYKNGEKLEHYRWWKITKVETSKDGFLLLGELTESQRDFSD